MQNGYLITFEGIDGCGKSTAANLLAEYMQAVGHKVTLTYEPGAGQLGSKLRYMLLSDSALKPEVRAEALLFAADRAAHMEEIILPALRAGHIVLCDRFTDSTLAYQGGGRGLCVSFLDQLNEFASFGIKPRITFLLDLPQQLARQRRGQSQDRLEREDEEFFARIAVVYHKLAAAEPDRIKILDASQTPQQILSEMIAAIESLY